MRRLLLLVIVTCLVSPALSPSIRAQDAPPPDDEARERAAWDRDLAERAANGDLFDEEAEAELANYLRNRTLRPKLDSLAMSYYEMADIQLGRNQAREAADTLRALLKRLGTRNDETVNATRYNIARLLRLHLGDAAAAAKELRLVRGNLQGRARDELLDTLIEGGQVDEAAEMIKQWINDAAEKPEKVALMHQLAGLYKKAGREDDALAMYQRITTEVTPEEIEAWRAKAAAWVVQQTDEVLRLRNGEEWDKADAAEDSLWQRYTLLRRQRRADEAEAMGKALDAAEQRLNAWDREHPDK